MDNFSLSRLDAGVQLSSLTASCRVSLSSLAYFIGIDDQTSWLTAGHGCQTPWLTAGHGCQSH